MTIETHECSLCGDTFTGYGHNPAPLAHHDQRCCDVCNDTKVIPARLHSIRLHNPA